MPVKQVDLDALDKLAYDTDTISQEGLVREAIAELRELRELLGCATVYETPGGTVFAAANGTRWYFAPSGEHDGQLRFDTLPEALAAARKWEVENG